MKNCGGQSLLHIETSMTKPIHILLTLSAATAATIVASHMGAFVDRGVAYDPAYVEADHYDPGRDTALFAAKRQDISLEFSGHVVGVGGDLTDVDYEVEGGHATLHLHARGIVVSMRGSSPDGALKVYSDHAFTIRLDGVDLESESSAVINNQSHKRMTIVATAGTENELRDAKTYRSGEDETGAEDQKGCIFSEGQIVIAGSGRLSVTGRHKHAVCSDDYVVLTDSVRLTIPKAKGDGIHANDYIVIRGGETDIHAGHDCMEVERHGGWLLATSGKARLTSDGKNEFDTIANDYKTSACLRVSGDIVLRGADIRAENLGDGGKGLRASGRIIVSGGRIDVTTKGNHLGEEPAPPMPMEEMVLMNRDSIEKLMQEFMERERTAPSASAKGMRAKGDINISGGSIRVRTEGTRAEGIETKSDLTVTGGDVRSYATDDAINASGEATSVITISGGRVTAVSSGNDGIDTNGDLYMLGGELTASGSDIPETGIDVNVGETPGVRFEVHGGRMFGIGGGADRVSAHTQDVVMTDMREGCRAGDTIRVGTFAYVADKTLRRATVVTSE